MTTILFLTLPSIGTVTATELPDWRRAPRKRARLAIVVRLVHAEDGGAFAYWRADGSMYSCIGLDEASWKTVQLAVRDALLERAVARFVPAGDLA